eukprot:gene22892-30068_t
MPANSNSGLSAHKLTCICLSLLLVVSVGYNCLQYIVKSQSDGLAPAPPAESAQPSVENAPGGGESKDTKDPIQHYLSQPVPYEFYTEEMSQQPQTDDFLELGNMLERMGMQTGVELGVKKGNSAKRLFVNWPSCSKLYLVDLWDYQENYSDAANVDDKNHLLNLEYAKQQLEPYKSKTVFIKNSTVDAAQLIPDNLDFVFVDARHDYCAVMEDMDTYWPKLRPGGIMAGNGTSHPGAVKGAVHDFAMKHGLFVSVT